MAKAKTTVTPPAPPDVKGMREAQKAAQLQHAPDEQDETDGSTVEQLRTHLHAALDLLDELEPSQ
jgi:hypothetical protein